MSVNRLECQGSEDYSTRPPFSRSPVSRLHMSGDDILRKFWEIEESPTEHSPLSVEERTVMRHFDSNHSHSKEGRFVVPLPKDPNARLIGESRLQAVRRFFALEYSLKARGRFRNSALLCRSTSI